ncbi:aminodeoxychorismate synthase component I [Streptomyces sp. NPDC093085]|uniref:aminodeoxychorismate synthase component I n=1 Tax=Streptomyces sp. NPDC093085 TaxID=3155068 RepID=UPI003441D0F7
MRTLLIDNYDSYTYNLFQLIAEVNGEEPVVVLNDAPSGSGPDLREFDNIVVSPGPGHPGTARDFGINTALLARSGIPVLGVCLGHQGIAVGESAQVVTAPRPRHGHLSVIRHDGRELFRGIPQNFTAVRYHSLAVREPLPPTLEATAWAEDGVLMGLRHRTRPMWGVQFHPESILTEGGHRMLGNFADLTRAWRHGERTRPVGRRSVPSPRAAAGRRRTPAAASEGEREPAPAGPGAPAGAPATISAGVTASAPADSSAPPGRYRLHSRMIGTAVDTEAAFTRMCAGAPRAFWLDSASVEEGRARFSFFGDGAGPLAELVRHDTEAGRSEIERPGHPPRTVPGSVFDYLQGELAARTVDAPELPFDFTGGYVGYLGYEVKAECGSPNRHRAGTPDACWLFADRFVVVDHQESTTYAVALAEPTPEGAREAAEWLDSAVALLSCVPAAPVPGAAQDLGGRPRAGRPAAGLTVTDLTAAEPWLERDRATYLADIEACRKELAAGVSYEICLTNAADLPAPSDTFGFYRALRRHNPAPYAAFLSFGEVEVACSSPERFLRIGRDGTVEAKPIKGTAPRGARPEEDALLRDALAADEKTRAENLMIVDLLRNDLGRVCRTGSVEVPRLMATETYATVHQLVSTVRGRLRAGQDAVACVRACFPGGSMTGAPKLRTLEIIDRLETSARGVYSGAIGYLSCNGAADLNIVIRTAVFSGGRMRLGAGGAIVLGSDPVAEYDEMLLKTAAPLRAYRDVTVRPDAPHPVLPVEEPVR